MGAMFRFDLSKSAFVSRRVVSAMAYAVYAEWSRTFGPQEQP